MMNAVRSYRKVLIPLVAFLLIFSCTVQKKLPEPPQQVKKEEKKEENRKVIRGPEVAVSRYFRCADNTSSIFNSSGIAVQPFMKLVFHDMDQDGLSDIVTGSKNGNVHFYKNSGTASSPRWTYVKGYFDGVRTGAFSSPALADINGDGKDEIVLGSGGFSSDSGRILFYENRGTKSDPAWKKMNYPEPDIGDDAAVTVVDYNFDNAPDIIAGNSEGKMFFFRNSTKNGRLRFDRDNAISIPQVLDKYAVPAAVRLQDKTILLVGTSMGDLFRFEMNGKSGKLSGRKITPVSVTKRFLSPSFADLIDKGRFDLVMADGDGSLDYYENRKNDFMSWGKNDTLFQNRIVTGPACAPTAAMNGNGLEIVVGTVDGGLKFYKYDSTSRGLPWIEKKNYFRGIKLSGYSRGVITRWEGNEMLVTGENDGSIRAFMNSGSHESPSWTEKKKFFQNVRAGYHSSPAVFDIDDDGKWELITGADDGRIYAYSTRAVKNGLPVWEVMKGVFDSVRVQGFSSPSILRNGNALYLFVGQEDGKIRTFAADMNRERSGIKNPADIKFKEIQSTVEASSQGHSSPFAVFNNNKIELISGDYDGNLRHFICSGS